MQATRAEQFRHRQPEGPGSPPTPGASEVLIATDALDHQPGRRSFLSLHTASHTGVS
jgi:hypothetical protein